MASTSISSNVLVQRGSQVLSRMGSAFGLLDSEDDRIHWQEVQVKRIQLGHAGLQSLASKILSDKVLDNLEQELKSCSSTVTTDGKPIKGTDALVTTHKQSNSSELKGRRSASFDAHINAKYSDRFMEESKRRIYVSPETSTVPAKEWTDSFASLTKMPYFELMQIFNRGAPQKSLSHSENGEETQIFGKEAVEYHRFCLEQDHDRLVSYKNYKEKRDQLLKRQHQLHEIIHVAREHYFGRYGIQEEKWKKMAERSSTNRRLNIDKPPFIRTQMEGQVLYRPWATFIYVLVQFISLFAMTLKHGLAEVDLEPKIKLSSDITTLLGVETVARWSAPNMWIGPSSVKLVESGALYAPCMREDINVLSQMAKNVGDSPLARLGCCTIVIRKLSATTTERECLDYTNGVGRWMADTPCSWRPLSSFNETSTARPCCVGIQGSCLLVTESHCNFLEGFFHASGPEHCTQVDCLARTCGESSEPRKEFLYYVSNSSAEGPSVIKSTPLSQHWRILTAAFLPCGWLSFLPEAALMLVLGKRVETSAGWPRMVLIYTTCSTGGLLVGTLFSTVVPHMGGHAAVSGLLGVITVDIIQCSSLLVFPWRDLIKLSAIIILELLIGTFPYVDNYELIGGFVFGVLSALVLLPYISLGRWHVMKRRLLIILATPALVILFAVILYLLYTVQTLRALCMACLTFTCAQYTTRMCDVMKMESERPQLA